MPILNMVWWWKKWGNIWEPLNLTVTTSWLDATITWEDNEIWTIPPTSFQKSELVRKIGSAPTSPSDWDLVVTETVKDTYKVSGYTDSWLTGWTTYYYRVFSYSDLGGISYCDAESVTISSGWWQPWVNTVAYYPLDSTNTVNDLSGNNYTLSGLGYTFWTNQWVDCVSMVGTFWQSYLNNSTIPVWSTRTWLAWVYATTANSSQQWVICTWTYYSSTIVWMWVYQNDAYITDWRSFDTKWTTNIIWWWHNIWFTWTSWWPIYLYVDWVLEATSTNLGRRDDTWFTIGAKTKEVWLWDWSEPYTWLISNVIFEDVAWTAQDFADYFDLTKWNYWIS
jgi:hypothetical protein